MQSSSNNPRRSVFLEAEMYANEFSLLKDQKPAFLDDSTIAGILSKEAIEESIRYVRSLDVDAYIQHTVVPTENQKRRNAPDVIRSLGGKLITEESDGPLYMSEIEFLSMGRLRRFGFIAQNRKFQGGVWYPQHHLKAAEKARFFASHGMPLITFMDTPGAAADADANLHNQSHSISFFIAEMANLQLPTVGIVFGHGYSGGAIPLATTNILLCLKDGVFNTIHPKGLSNIARKYNLSWQECAKYIGISSYELYAQGYFDGIINYTPDQPQLLPNLRSAILSAVECVEKNAATFLLKHDFFFDHYRENIQHFLKPAEMLIEDNKLTDKTPTGILNVFGSVYRFLRYLKLRQKISSQSIGNYSRLSNLKIPEGKLLERLNLERQEKFHKWLNQPLELRFHDELDKKYRRFIEASQNKENERGKLVTFFRGDPIENFEKAIKELTSDLLLYFYNLWKENTTQNLVQLYEYLNTTTPVSSLKIVNVNLLDVLCDPPIHASFRRNFQNIILFDLLFNSLIENLPSIAGELKGTNQISQTSVEKLFEDSVTQTMREFEKWSLPLTAPDAKERFFKWLNHFIVQKNCDEIMMTISDWKSRAFPRLSPPLFGLIRYYFSNLLPSLYEVHQGKGKFQGKITPRNIGIKDFWYRLDRAYKDLLIHQLLGEYKLKTITPKMIYDRFFEEFEELYKDRMTSDPVNFPGFRQAIEKALQADITPCGIVTGLATFKDQSLSSEVGLVISNTSFQAGAFDMASCEKLCKLLAVCAQRKLPVIMFISSGGMQTKEGAGALFSMSVVNDRITRFVKDKDLPIICFGFRDCMGGAQASFVTHRLVKKYYLSGTLMSFAGQLVVESHLPMNAILSNYISEHATSMESLIYNPFDEAIDQKLRTIDESIPVAQLTVREVIARILTGEYRPSEASGNSVKKLFLDRVEWRPIKRVLVHSRGCTATRIIHSAHEMGIEVVLVQSDADMDSFPASTLQGNDRLVCIGGNTPQESYLNGMSVIRVAEQEVADAIHPGIGFLSESPSYAKICREHDLNFIGPKALTMNLMGNKSNAIDTARRLNIPVVNGSEGALTDPTYAQIIADEIGFPVLIKAAHGGGGKGIRVVYQASEFVSTFNRMSLEARNAFGKGDLYLEKFVASMRHLEVQVLRDSKNHTLLLGIRDCTVQRNYQKLIEESVPNSISTIIREKLYEYAQMLVDEIDYIGAGTVEFIYDRNEQKVYFMEMNTRLQVEHPVSEMVSGVDIVHKQFEIASGFSIEQSGVQLKGHAMELRINAESMEFKAEGVLNFLPDPGVISGIVLPTAPQIRVISAVTNNSKIPPYYDSLIAQIIAWDESRAAVIQRLLHYLERVRINGVYTNLALMEAILNDEQFQSEIYDTNFIENFLKRTDVSKIIAKNKINFGQATVSIDRQTIQIPDSAELKILSPQTGAFYRSATQNDPPLVEVGQLITKQQTLCLLESMKIFNELNIAAFKTDDGESLYGNQSQFLVKHILASDGQVVSRGDLLFVVEPQ